MVPERFDAIVLGTGQAGKPLALAAAGRRTAVVEREYVGGTCVNVGRTPTKAMVASARVACLARRAADYGVRCGPVALDMAQVRARKLAIVDDFRAGGGAGLRRPKTSNSSSARAASRLSRWSRCGSRPAMSMGY